MIDAARVDLLTVIAEAAAAGELRPQAEALTLLGSAEIAVGAYDAADETLADALELSARDRRRRGRRRRVARARYVASVPGRSRAGGALRVRGARGVPLRRRERGPRGRSRISRGSRSAVATSRAEDRLQQSAQAFAELGDWGGLGWAYGLLAFVRYNQGRIEEAATLAEHISSTGGRPATAGRSA